MRDAEKYIDLYNDKSNSDDVAFGHLEKAYNLLMIIKDNPLYVCVINAENLNDQY